VEDKTFEFKQENRVQVQIRSATTEDIAPIALLCQELGYSTSEQDVQERLRRFEQDAERVVYVAYLPNVGWVHVYISEALLTGRRAEIDGLIVNKLYRDCGAGRLLMRWKAWVGLVASVPGWFQFNPKGVRLLFRHSSQVLSLVQR
jgi:hypothetical protein